MRSRAGRPRRSGTVPGLLLLVGSIGCGLTPVPDEPASLGRPNRGRLVHGVGLADRGTGWVRARPGERTRHGHPRLLGALQRAAAAVDARFPGTVPLRIGDLSGPGGGHHPRHGSHRTGRDADLIFYLTDPAGRSVRGRGWLAFDGLGVAQETRLPGDRPGSGTTYRFDTARNWWLVRSLLADPDAAVQWIFVANPIKARLLRHGRRHDPDPALVLRAAWVLHQPSRGNPHADHFHVRLLCTAREQALGCRNTGPVWPWLRKAHEKPARPPGVPDDDPALLDALRSEVAKTADR